MDGVGIGLVVRCGKRWVTYFIRGGFLVFIGRMFLGLLRVLFLVLLLGILYIGCIGLPFFGGDYFEWVLGFGFGGLG